MSRTIDDIHGLPALGGAAGAPAIAGVFNDTIFHAISSRAAARVYTLRHLSRD